MSNKKAMKKEINFYTRYLYNPQKEERRRKLLVFCLPIIILVIMIGGTFAFLKISTAMDRAEMKECDAYISSPDNITNYQESQALQSQRDLLVSQYNGLNEVLKNIESYPIVNSSLLAQANRAVGSLADVTSLSYDSSNGILVIAVETPSVDNMPSVIKSVKETGLFGAVSYTGYSLGEDKYAANVICLVEKQ